MPQQNPFELKFIFIFENIFAGIDLAGAGLTVSDNEPNLSFNKILNENLKIRKVFLLYTEYFKKRRGECAA